ncbi:ParA family protein [Paenibacillus polymyxa]|uniref:ParA family protein n=1 Tax=Paenibacillus polymyxa TaxID=1406 RepID=UPI001E4DC573|nr:AAA family ATPase [Paenibacillus polymyxa]
MLSSFCVYRREGSNFHGFPLDTECNLSNTLFNEGKKALLVDFDPQGNLSMYFGIEQRDQLP